MTNSMYKVELIRGKSYTFKGVKYENGVSAQYDEGKLSLVKELSLLSESVRDSDGDFHSKKIFRITKIAVKESFIEENDSDLVDSVIEEETTNQIDSSIKTRMPRGRKPKGKNTAITFDGE